MTWFYCCLCCVIYGREACTFSNGNDMDFFLSFLCCNPVYSTDSLLNPLNPMFTRDLSSNWRACASVRAKQKKHLLFFLLKINKMCLSHEKCISLFLSDGSNAYIMVNFWRGLFLRTHKSKNLFRARLKTLNGFQSSRHGHSWWLFYRENLLNVVRGCKRVYICC